jgi:hypothetical protein
MHRLAIARMQVAEHQARVEGGIPVEGSDVSAAVAK